MIGFMMRLWMGMKGMAWAVGLFTKGGGWIRGGLFGIFWRRHLLLCFGGFFLLLFAYTGKLILF